MMRQSKQQEKNMMGDNPADMFNEVSSFESVLADGKKKKSNGAGSLGAEFFLMVPAVCCVFSSVMFVTSRKYLPVFLSLSLTTNRI